MNNIQSCLLAWVLALPGAVLGDDLAVLIENCNGCHGPQGVSTDGDVPSIAGQTAAFIASTLHSYQEWGRPCKKSAYRHGDASRAATTMCKVSDGLTSEDIEALGKYYAQQAFVAAKQAFDVASAAAGAQLHETHCESCHEQGGSVAARGPILAGQWMPYLKVAARQALSGEHLVPPLMENELANFSDEEMDALMNFYVSQQGSGD